MYQGEICADMFFVGQPDGPNAAWVLYKIYALQHDDTFFKDDAGASHPHRRLALQNKSAGVINQDAVVCCDEVWFRRLFIRADETGRTWTGQQRDSAIDHPAHYGGADDPYEAIKVIEAWNLGFCLGNTVKYIRRAGIKDQTAYLEDLKKSRWYLDHEIERLERAAREPTTST